MMVEHIDVVEDHCDLAKAECSTVRNTCLTDQHPGLLGEAEGPNERGSCSGRLK